ncbi:MAG TPA: hypothetical protein VE734_07550 [Terriglobales bacterium]|jgi:TnpA family transposase|nr:hypothetical protein [Terriglobales bacterium]
MQINFSVEELNLLAELLRRDYHDLREEIHKTDDHRFKDDLRAREKLVGSLLAKFEAAGAATTA